MNDDAFIYRIALTQVDRIGDVIAKQLISHCGSPEAVFKEKKRNLLKIPDVGPATANAISRFKEFDRAACELEFIRRHGIQMLYYTDADYPKRLAHCHDSPVMLYFKGTADLNSQRMVAIVGTRKCTEYGKHFTESICDELGQMGVHVVSGLAYGIDITAHRKCVASGIPTIGVVAHGLDRIYPTQHRTTAKQMLENGGLLTEHISGSEPDRENFPRRNRIIAGICDAVIVAEAASKGGALITADIANSYNRDVFALPGRIHDSQSEGCNHLIKTNRAAMIQSAADIRYIMGWDDATEKKPVQSTLFPELSEEEKCFVKFIEANKPAPIDHISLQMKRSQSSVAAILLNLEFKGIIRCLPGKLYVTV